MKLPESKPYRAYQALVAPGLLFEGRTTIVMDTKYKRSIHKTSVSLYERLETYKSRFSGFLDSRVGRTDPYRWHCC